MTATLLSLLSVVIGIIGAYTFSYFFKKYSFGITGNSILGVFGSVLLIKTFGRLGFNPAFIITHSIINYYLLAVNLAVSFFGGVLAVYLAYHLKNRFKKKQK